jgi:hypothetical protein
MIIKWVKDLNSHLIKDDIQIRNMHTWEVFHAQLENCKLKQQ